MVNLINRWVQTAIFPPISSQLHCTSNFSLMVAVSIFRTMLPTSWTPQRIDAWIWNADSYKYLEVTTSLAKYYPVEFRGTFTILLPSFCADGRSSEMSPDKYWAGLWKHIGRMFVIIPSSRISLRKSGQSPPIIDSCSSPALWQELLLEVHCFRQVVLKTNY